MESVRNALRKIVKADRRIQELRELYIKVGLNDDPLFETHGDLMDAVYTIIGEHLDGEFEDSITALAMETPFLNNERRVEMLMAEYRKNHPEQPKPNTIKAEEILDLYKKNGGYTSTIISPEGEWK